MATDRLFPERGRTGNGRLRHACRLLAVLGTFGGALLLSATEPKHVVLVVWDGMRPDFATEQYAPTLAISAELRPHSVPDDKHDMLRLSRRKEKSSTESAQNG